MTRDLRRSFPEGYAALRALEEAVGNQGIEPRLLELVRLRASELNRCQFCIGMHTDAARAAGESPARIQVLASWRESPEFNEAERCALELAEALTGLGAADLEDSLVQRAEGIFGSEGLVQLAYAIAAINAWNRLVAVVSPRPGGHQDPGVS